jgi:hypothetical protein
MIITDPGNGPTPRAGQFLNIKQFVYKEDMTQLKADRVTYLFGREQLLPGLEICLSVCREGFKARCFLAAEFAYGKKEVKGIPFNSPLVIDIEVQGIMAQPITR